MVGLGDRILVLVLVLSLVSDMDDTGSIIEYGCYASRPSVEELESTKKQNLFHWVGA